VSEKYLIKLNNQGNEEIDQLRFCEHSV